MIKIPRIKLKFPFERIINEFNIYPGEAFKILGDSGYGKTTYIITLTEKIISSNNFANIIYIKQAHRLPPYSILKDIFEGIPKAKYIKILNELDLNKTENSICSDFSGGEIQRVLIAEAILRKPKLIIMDEPVSAVDKKGTRKIQFILNRYLKSGGALLFVSHVKLIDNHKSLSIDGHN